MIENKETTVVYLLASIYEYVNDITEFCEDSCWDVDKILSSKHYKHAINMCIVQIGEHASRIKKYDEELYNNESLHLYEIKGMRDRIVHAYDKISYPMIKASMLHDVPDLKQFLEDTIPNELLENPYLLFDDDFNLSEIYQGIIDKVTSPKEKEQDYGMIL